MELNTGRLSLREFFSQAVKQCPILPSSASAAAGVASAVTS